MENQIRENLRSMLYKGKTGKFKSDVIDLLNDGPAHLNNFPGLAENIYKRAYARENSKGLTDVLNECLELNSFFQKTANIVLKASK